MTLNNVEPPGF